MCAATGEICECEYQNMIVYGQSNEFNKLDYMEGFSKALAQENGKTECSFDNFGDPSIGFDKHCWCQRWVLPNQNKLKLGKCYNFSTQKN